MEAQDPQDAIDHEEAIAYAQEEEETPEAKKAKKASILAVLKKLREIEKRHEEGEPVYAEMAARIEARHEEATQALIREAMEGE
ncbi:MAG: hypothetical protein K5880_13770 [Hydrogenophaga sp.]|uniref:hypothetical protein n=1 Tax=Hydrogenophaga sp. TaxID=1904254 RepID=UPI002602D111|nr:hypothetical protein [Hydrogenophaga sp.]MCV0439689.1 hypothetical protein [Hydrogenophaga sp.]